MSNYSENQMINDPNHVWSKIIAFIKPGSEVLDIGCSSGNLGTVLIEQKHCTVDGVEPEPEDARQAATHLRKVWQLSIEDPAAVKQIGRQYDVLVFADVLEHLLDPVKTLQAVKVLVKPGGQVVFSLPNMAHVSVRLSLLQGNFDYTETGLLDKTHLHFYDVNHVKEMFTSAGLSIEKLDASSYQYPKRVLASKLEDLGFKALDKGLELLSEPDAASFQYVGYAAYSKQPAAADLKPTTPVIQKDMEGLLDKISERDKTIQKLNTDMNGLHTELGRLQTELQQLVNSKTFRAAQAITSPYRAAHKSLKNVRRKG